MKYQVLLTADDPKGTLAKAFATEQRKNNRSQIKIGKKGKELVITFYADDAIALKAGTHSMVQLLHVHEQMEKIVNE